MSEVGSTYFTLVFSGDVAGTFRIPVNSLGVAEFNARYLLENYIYSQIALPTQSTLPNGLKTYSVEITSSLATVLNLTPFNFINAALQGREFNFLSDGYILNNNRKKRCWFNGVDSKLIFADLIGVNIVRYQGTSILSIVGNEIHGTKGSCWNLLLDNGEFYAELCTGKGEVITFTALFNRVLDTSANYNIYDIFNAS
jgi:hypothetical protein